MVNTTDTNGSNHPEKNGSNTPGKNEHNNITNNSDNNITNSSDNNDQPLINNLNNFNQLNLAQPFEATLPESITTKYFVEHILQECKTSDNINKTYNFLGMVLVLNNQYHNNKHSNTILSVIGLGTILCSDMFIKYKYDQSSNSFMAIIDFRNGNYIKIIDISHEIIKEMIYDLLIEGWPVIMKTAEKYFDVRSHPDISLFLPLTVSNTQ